MSHQKPCPCCSGVPYENCCKPSHDGLPAENPLQLMRSRYSAFALNKPYYIIEIRPYLHEYPFTAKNVAIRIFIYNPDRSELPLEKIDCITALNGMLKYYTRSNPRQAIYEETYEEALQEIALNQEFTEGVSQKIENEVIF